MQRQRGTAWQRRLLLFDASQCGGAIEVSFEDKERTIIKVCRWNDKGIAANDVRTDWKQIGFIVSVTCDDLTNQEAHVVFDWRLYIHAFISSKKIKFVFPLLPCLDAGETSRGDEASLLFRFITASGVGLLWTWSHKKSYLLGKCTPSPKVSYAIIYRLETVKENVRPLFHTGSPVHGKQKIMVCKAASL